MNYFKNANVYVEGRGIIKTDLSFGEKIVSLDKVDSGEEISLPESSVVLPGFIDEHIHGAQGYDAMDGTEDALKGISNALVKEGTTSFLATTMTESKDKIKKSLKSVKSVIDNKSCSGAELLGVHLEGPFIGKEFHGAQPIDCILSPDISLFDELNKASGNNVKIITVAPEVKGAEDFISYLSRKGIVVSVGHSSAKYDDVLRAVKNGAKNITHTYNAQSKFHHRDIGVVGSSLLIDELNSEIIADTVHVSVPAIKLLVKCKNKDKITLITDAMRAKGVGDGESELGGQKVFVHDGEARLSDGTLAGSVLKMNIAVKNMVEKVGVSLTDAIDFATINPAKTLGIDGAKGSIKVGKDADFVVLDKNFNVVMTVKSGKIVYKA